VWIKVTGSNKKFSCENQSAISFNWLTSIWFISHKPQSHCGYSSYSWAWFLTYFPVLSSRKSYLWKWSFASDSVQVVTLTWFISSNYLGLRTSILATNSFTVYNYVNNYMWILNIALRQTDFVALWVFKHLPLGLSYKLCLLSKLKTSAYLERSLREYNQ
jgi:hypothetical protein